MLIATAQQQLGRIDRSGAYENFGSGDVPVLAAAVVAEMDDVPVGTGSDVTDFAPGDDRGPMPLGDGEVVEVEGVLGVGVAPDVALAAMAAPRLFDAELVAPCAGRVPEVDRQVRAEGRRTAAEVGGDLLHQNSLGLQAVWLIRRHRGDVKHVAGKVVVGIKLLTAEAVRPTMIEQVSWWPVLDVGVSQRSAAVSGGLNDEHVVERAHIE